MAKKTWIVENSWTCKSCKSSVQKGRHTTCQECGAPKGSDVVDRIPNPSSAPRVTDENMLRDAKAGANWVCEYCGKQERNNRGDCTYCAADRGGVKAVSRSLKGTWKSESVKDLRVFHGMDAEEELVDVLSREIALEIDREILSFPWHRRHRRKIKFGLAALVVGLLVWLGLWLFLPHEVDTTVTSTTWEYTMELQQRETRSGEGWDGDRPDSHFNDSCRTKQRGTEDCNPHDCNAHSESYDCNPHDCSCHDVCSDNGNGYSSCHQSCSTCYDSCSRTVYDTCYDQCAVYDQWCEYDYYAWPTILNQRTSGDDHEVHWPVMPEPKALQRIQSDAKYHVIFTGKEDTWDIAPKSLNEFTQYTRGTMWKIKVNRAGKVEPLHELKAEAD